MNALLRLVAGLVEQSSDPRYGDAVNEMAAWRFEEALEADGVLRSRLVGEHVLDEDDDFEAMGFGSWVWLLAWRQRQGAGLDEPVLAALTARATSVDRRLRLRTLVGRDPRLEREVGSIDEFRFRPRPRLPSPWLDGQVVAAASGRIDPFELSRHLLQLGTDVTMAALAELLEAPGDYQGPLREEILAALPVDPDRRGPWLRRLGLDAPGRG